MKKGEENSSRDITSISDFKRTNTGEVSFTFFGKASEINDFQKILHDVPTIAVHGIIVDQNNSPFNDENLAHTLGLHVVDNDAIEKELYEAYDISAVGPGYYYTGSFPEIPFKYNSRLFYLKEGQNIQCRVVLQKGIAIQHMKWAPAVNITYQEVEQGVSYRMKFQLTGSITANQLITEAFQIYNQRPPEGRLLSDVHAKVDNRFLLDLAEEKRRNRKIREQNKK